MADDRKRFNGARSHWNELRREQRFSVPVYAGEVAIFVSTFTHTVDEATSELQREAFAIEGAQIAERLAEKNRKATVLPATEDTFIEAIRDKSITSMYTIGHGALTCLRANDAGLLTWQAAAAATDHLKTGLFVQRQCGNTTLNLNVPLGLFVMHDPRNVYAAVGAIFPAELTPEDETLITPVVTTSDIGNYASIKRRFPQDTFTTVEQVTQILMPNLPF